MAKDPKKAPPPPPPPRKSGQRPKPPSDEGKPYWRHGSRYTPPPPPLTQDPILRERRRLSAPFEEEKGLGLKENDMNYKRPKGLGMATGDWASKSKTAVNPRPGSESRMPYTPGTGETKTMPYTPGTGSMQKMPYRPKPGTRPMSYDSAPMDMGWESDTPPGYATMEYDPARDGSAYEDMPPYDGDGVGAETMGKQENNQQWRYDNWRSEEGRPIPEDKANVYNDIFDEGARQRPDVSSESGNPTEIAMWERNVRKRAAEAGLTEDEIDELINDLYDLD